MRKLGIGLAAAVLAVSTVFGAVTFKNTPQVMAADNEYTYVYAGLSWEEYWNAEGVYNASNTQSSDVKDDHGETDKGGFDTVSRATYNHGLHRGSFQCEAVIFDTNGKTYDVAYWTGSKDAVKLVLTDGSECAYDSKAKTLTLADGSVVNLDHYEVKGLKYVPVKVKTSDYEDFKTKYNVVENGGVLEGGYTENKLNAYSETANVTADTNGLKEAMKNSDGTYSFAARSIGSESGIKDSALKTVSDVTVNLRSTDTESNITGSYGEFLRVDLTGNYGDLGANLQAVKWTYYGSDITRTNALATYGTKFAADNWMHKVNGIQLGLTDSYRCQLPEGTDGTGYWTVTVYALGYEDYSFNIETAKNNLYFGDDSDIDTSSLSEAINAAKALNESDYTADSWASLKTELAEAEEEFAAPHSNAAVVEATEHLNNAIASLVKVETKEEETKDNNSSSDNTENANTSNTTDSTTTNTDSKAQTESTSTVNTYDAAQTYVWFAVAMSAVMAAAFAYGKKNKVNR